MKKTSENTERARRARRRPAKPKAEPKPRPQPSKPASTIAEQHELLCILTDQAREGNVAAARALLAWHRRAVRDEPAEPAAGDDDWSAIYGDGNNVTPLRRKT